MAPQRRTPRRRLGARGEPRRTRAPGSRPARPVRASSASGGDPVARRAPAARERGASPRLTGRAAVLVLVLAVLTVSYASSLRAYLQQRSHIGDLKRPDRRARGRASTTSSARSSAGTTRPTSRRRPARGFGYVMPGRDGLRGARRGRQAARAQADRSPTPPTCIRTVPDRLVDRRPGTRSSWPATRPPPARGPVARRRADRRAPASSDASTPPTTPRSRAQLGRAPRAIHDDRPPLPVRQPRRRDHRAAARPTARRSRRPSTSPARARPRGSAPSRRPA